MVLNINLWAVLVSGVVSMVIGSIWYGPLFGKMYMREMGMDTWSEEKKVEMKKCMMKSYLVQFVASLVMFYFLACFITTGSIYFMTRNYYTVFNSYFYGVTGGILTAFAVWIGFVVPLKLGDALWGGKMSLFWLAIGANLVTLLSVGAILGAWN